MKCIKICFYATLFLGDEVKDIKVMCKNDRVEAPNKYIVVLQQEIHTKKFKYLDSFWSACYKQICKTVLSSGSQSEYNLFEGDRECYAAGMNSLRPGTLKADSTLQALSVPFHLLLWTLQAASTTSEDDNQVGHNLSFVKKMLVEMIAGSLRQHTN